MYFYICPSLSLRAESQAATVSPATVQGIRPLWCCHGGAAAAFVASVYPLTLL